MEPAETGPEPLDQRALEILKAFDRLGLSRLTAADFATATSGAAEAQAPLAHLVQAGYLRENLGAYERTEAGRLEIAGPANLTLLSRSGCHLCHQALPQLETLAARYHLHLRVVDIDADAVLRARYSTHVPVVFLGSRELARHTIDALHIRAQLSRQRSRT
jgi:glutaredoxin